MTKIYVFSDRRITLPDKKISKYLANLGIRVQVIAGPSAAGMPGFYLPGQHGLQ